jgi:type IV pilus assembly protein PilN
LVGYAQSNARVSTLMRNLEASPITERPDLIEIKAATFKNRRLAEFSLNVMITRQTSEDSAMGKAAVAKTAAPGKEKTP